MQVEEVVNALSWVHQVAVVEDPTDHPLVKQIVAGAEWILAHRGAKKEPMTAEILHKLVEEFISDDAELPAVSLPILCQCNGIVGKCACSL